MRAHVLNDAGLILNTIEIAALAHGMVDASIGGQIGDSIVDGAVVPKQIPALTNAEHNAPILLELQQIDAKSIRALREGNQERITALESQAVALRSQLRKD
jgi:hypothetical protein